MNEIEHKIGIAVKKDCQVTISSLLQHMLGFRRAIFPQGDHVADWVADVTRTVWKRLSIRGQYCTGSKTLVTISASLPSTGTILNSGTWASPTILGSASGQYTYRELSHSWYNIKKREAWVHVDVYLEVNQLQRNTFPLPAGYFPSPKRILKAIEGKKHRTPLK
jgi:hypothetical protein